MKNLKGFNKKLGKYQPTIQTFGIILILVGLIVAIWQNNLTQKQIEEQRNNQNLERVPKFNFELRYENANRTLDYLELTEMNPKHVLNHMSIMLLGRHGLNKFTYFEKRINTTNIKKTLSDYEWLADKATTNFISHYQSDVLSFPVLIGIEYVENLNLNQQYLLYEYKFKIYDFENVTKLKTIGLEFIEFVTEDGDIEQYLKSYSLTKLKPLISKYYHDNLIWTLIQKDSSYRDLVSLIRLNLTFQANQIVVCRQQKNPLIVSYDTPAFLSDDSLWSKKVKVFERITSNSDKYSSKLLNRLFQVEDSINIFSEMTESLPDTICREMDSVEFFKKNKDIWVSLNNQTVNHLIENYNRFD